MLGPILVSLHNIRFYQRLMADIRRRITAGTFDEFRRTDPRALLGPPAKREELAGQQAAETT
jgi:tRNA-guanine family transglycosylase